MVATLVLLAAGLGTGALIGTVGVGGVLLAPLLVLVGGYDLHAAMPIASFSFLFTGVAGAAAYLRRGSVDRRTAAWTGAAAAPGAVAGAWANTALPAAVLVVLLVLVVVASAARELLRPPAGGRAATARPLSRASLAALGAVVGFGSALTGTGGPVLLVPLLLLAGAAPLVAVGASQVVQLPVALAATAGFTLFGEIDLAMGAALGLTQAAGVLVGARLAHALPARRLGRLVAVALLAVAGLLLARLAVPPSG